MSVGNDCDVDRGQVIEVEDLPLLTSTSSLLLLSGEVRTLSLLMRCPTDIDLEVLGREPGLRVDIELNRDFEERQSELPMPLPSPAKRLDHSGQDMTAIADLPNAVRRSDLPILSAATPLRRGLPDGNLVRPGMSDNNPIDTDISCGSNVERKNTNEKCLH